MSGGTAERQSTVLVIDDEPANVVFLTRLLGRMPDLRVVGVTCSSDAVQSFVDTEPDLVLLDLHMPEPDGFKLLRLLREFVAAHEYLPILVLTADTSRENRKLALALGASDFLAKPFDAMEVLLRIRNLLETRRLHQRAAAETVRLEAQVLERTRSLEKALEAAQVADRAKDEFLMNVIHEFRTPLEAIRGAVGLLGQALPAETPEPATRLVQFISRGAERLECLVGDVLLLRGLQSGSIQPRSTEVDMDELVEALVREMDADGTSTPVEIRTLVPQDLEPIRTDRTLLEQVLRRLVEHALRHVEAGVVTLEVSGDPEQHRPDAISITGTAPNVAAERHHPSISDGLKQGDDCDPRCKGEWGGGLTIIRALCDILGLTLSVDCEAGHEVRFSLEVTGAVSGVDR